MRYTFLLILFVIGLFVGEAQAYHFVCYDKLERGISKNLTAMLIPYEADIMDKAGAVFSLIADAETMSSSKDISLSFKRRGHNPLKPTVILEGVSDGESFALKLESKGMIRHLKLENRTTGQSRKYKCFAESSI
jgi:hypothetical protein